VTPPAGRAAETHQTRGLCGDAVRRHELLLLADGAHEAECVHAEAEQPHQRDRQQGGARRERQPRPVAGPTRREHEERQRQSGRDLDPHTGGQRRRTGAHVRARRTGPRGERQRGGQREHQQRVVVRPSHRQQHEHGVQADERRRPVRRLPQSARRPRGQRHRAEAREDRDRLERPQPSCGSERYQCVAQEREQRSVGGM
jgi:hypothetical protein